MKLSEMIKKLQSWIEEHGDLPVIVRGDWDVPLLEIKVEDLSDDAHKHPKTVVIGW